MKKLQIKMQMALMLMALMLSGICWSCSNDKSAEPNPGDGSLEITLEVDKTELPFLQVAGKEELKITSNAKWTATSTASWCLLSQSSGTGDATIVVEVYQNEANTERRAEVIISVGTKKKITLPVVQLGKEAKTLFFVDGKEVGGEQKIEFDFEQQIYYLTVFANIPFEFGFNKVVPEWARMMARMDDYPDYRQRQYFLLRIEDNPEPEGRSAQWLIRQLAGPYERVLEFEQKPFEDFVRFFSDTVYAGSHFSLAELMGRTSMGWDSYEFVDGKPAWIGAENVEKEGYGYELGGRQKLIVDLEYNLTPTPRAAKIKFNFTSGGEKRSKVVTLLQLANNAQASDSLVLMKLCEKNANLELGLAVDYWRNGVPITSWSNLKTAKIDGVNRITDLLMTSTNMCYPLTADIANLSELKLLNIAKNYVGGALPKQLGRCTKLESLIVSENFCLAGNASPNYLAGGITDLPGELFSGCTHLKTLQLSVNRLSSLPDAIGDLTELEELDLGGNKELQTLPVEAMKKLKKLKYFSMYMQPNYKLGFPEFLFDLPYMETIDFFEIPFTGSIPDRFGEIPGLKKLIIDTCGLTGTLPVSLGLCTELTALTISRCGITGQLPPEYGNLTKVRFFQLADNNFEGPIPATFVKLVNVQSLFLSGNRLSGDIPEAIRQLDPWTINVSTFGWDPAQWICPQQQGYGFTVCP